ncbi:structural maintenance of chromosomes protein 6-like [Diadema setosum]|uniref:structural maintenance of chromosomes protein 6-like n=1 Tax=Diadema setosum TaxID=31175 RepID=UPI003B3B445B
MIRVLEKQLEKRKLKFQDLRRTIAARAQCLFVSMISNRGYFGQIKFDHVAGELNLIVDSDQSKALKGRRQNTSATNVRSLSGGERSFSTVCLIMALWESIESPFRVMDEFDVFMDMVTRRECMEMMQEFAEYQSYRQFIFLTPHDTRISAGRFIRIHQLHDPERNQAYLTADSEVHTEQELEQDE